MIVVPLGAWLARFDRAVPDGQAPTAVLAQFPNRAEAAETVFEKRDQLAASIDMARADGIEQARDEFEARLAAAKLDFEARLTTLRAEWVKAEGQCFAFALENALRRIKADLADRLAQAVKPVLLSAVWEKMVASLVVALDQLFAADRAILVELTGPEDLLAAILERLPDNFGRIHCVHAQTIDVRANVGKTVIDTMIGAWTRELEHKDNEAING